MFIKANQSAVHPANAFISHISAILLACLLFGLASPASAKTIEEKRRDYQAAIKALNKKQFKTFGQLANGLKDYPLYSYLRYEYVRKNLWKLKDDEIIAFLKIHADLPMTESLRTSWLKLLYKRKHWQTFLDNYVKKMTPYVANNYKQESMLAIMITFWKTHVASG